ncbi:MAG TPA: phosphoenolpyruvate synthase [Vicinamibacterales bacterium]|nr:phosphoenolpyruvate synthase [Vicinamibacterales bacterium]
MTNASFIRWFKDISLGDVPLVGGKNASLGEMYRELGSAGVRVPNGFAITADAYRHFLRGSGLDTRIPGLLDGLLVTDLANLSARGLAIRHAITEAELPGDLRDAIVSAYQLLGHGEPVDVAVRSSATAEDLPDASFAGQQETYLNVRGQAALLDACRRSFASLFTDRAISYRADKGFDQLQIALSIGVQQMVRSDLATSGIMFTLDTETGFPDVVLINASYGLGEPIVQGSVTPDEYCVFKPTLKTGFTPILHRTIGTKEFKLVYDEGGSRAVKAVPVPSGDRARCALNDAEILTLARWGCAIEDHYSRAYGHPTPMDIEWAKDGRSGDLFIVQARPETVHGRTAVLTLEQYRLRTRGRVLVTGRSVGGKIATGRVRVIPDAAGLRLFQPGEVLVTDKTDPDWEPIMKRAAAIVTNRGGRTCHAAIVSRELGVPAIVGTETGTTTLTTGQMVTVSCAEGENGFVYDGVLKFAIERTDLSAVRRPTTKIMMNVGNPAEAFGLAAIPNDGVGLARLEFIINNAIGVHPMALVRYATLGGQSRAEVDRITAGYTDKPAFFVDKLAENVGTLAAAFYPKDVIVRLSDFKTNEYARLAGGSGFEPFEENPMLGFRGASRYYDERYREGFALECRALKRVRDDMGLTNVKIMVPFCRTLDEARLVVDELARNGLVRHDKGLDLYMMVEIPSNVILLAEFARYFDGFSIGSNDLTQLTLGVDRDSAIVAHVFNERDPAVQSLIRQAIQRARELGRKIGLCGQAPSDYPEFARFLVECGIDSMSLNPDAVLATTQIVATAETARGLTERGAASIETDPLVPLPVAAGEKHDHART